MQDKFMRWIGIFANNIAGNYKEQLMKFSVYKETSNMK